MKLLETKYNRLETKQHSVNTHISADWKTRVRISVILLSYKYEKI